jgi:hypothetical protein
MAAPSWYTAGVGGQARSGKDTLGAHLVQRLNGIGPLGRWERRGSSGSSRLQGHKDRISAGKELLTSSISPAVTWPAST